jgi:ADP-heptose:LPS heptosyltransferase
MVPFAAYISSFLNAEKRIGMVEKRPFKGARWILDDLHCVEPNEHVISRYSEMFGLPVDMPDDFEKFEQTIDRTKKIQNILIHPGGKWELRRWPADRFKAVGDALQERGYSVRYLIQESEDDLLQHFKTSEFDGVGTLEVTRNIPDLLNAMERADLLIGNDSGPIHLAGLMDKPAVCIWGPGNYDRIHPAGRFVKTIIHPVPCRPCRQYRSMNCPDGKRTCLDSISVEDVLGTMEAVAGAAFDHAPNALGSE